MEYMRKKYKEVANCEVCKAKVRCMKRSKWGLLSWPPTLGSFKEQVPEQTDKQMHKDYQKQSTM